MKSTSVDTLLQQALRFLSFRQRSKHELRQYLNKKLPPDADTQVIDQVFTRLVELDLIDDQSFARTLAKSYLRKGKGPR